MRTIHVTTLGCDKNTVDSETMLALAHEKSYVIVDEPTEAEIIIVNTCCFIQESKEQSIDYILEYAGYKETEKCKILIVAGCMAERYHEELSLEIPDVDAFLGVAHFGKILDLIESLERTNGDLEWDATGTKDEQRMIKTDAQRAFLGGIDNELSDAKRYIKEGMVTAYVRISEGCDHGCTYCIIPKIRGRYRSRKQEDVFEELRLLQEKGIKEIILIGQDIAPYGKDLPETIDLSDLLEKIAADFDFKWIRLMYLYPESITDKLLGIIEQNPAICQYFDIPLQHLNDVILKRMGRKMSFEQIEKIIRQIRKALPDAVLRTSIITGFPGETLLEHKDLIEKIKLLAFNHLGVFKYSREENTPAASFEGQVSEEEKEKRANEIMMMQQSISFENKQKFLGKTLEVLLETFEDNVYTGRFYGDAPDIDGLVFVEEEKEPDHLITGNFYPVKIVQALEYDLIGDVVYEFTK